MPDPQSSTSISAAAVGGPDFLRGPESLGSKEKVARVKLTQFKRFLLSSVGGSIPIFKDRGQTLFCASGNPSIKIRRTELLCVCDIRKEIHQFLQHREYLEDTKSFIVVNKVTLYYSWKSTTKLNNLMKIQKFTRKIEWLLRSIWKFRTLHNVFKVLSSLHNLACTPRTTSSRC